MASKYKLEPKIILSVVSDGFSGVSLIVTDEGADILDLAHVPTAVAKYSYLIRKDIISSMLNLVNKYSVDTIMLEQNKLFTDSFTRYPDPYVLRNVLLDYGIKVSIEDTFADKIQYMLEIPEQEWIQKVLNSKVKYSIDLYKAHVRYRISSQELLTSIESNNYYKAICFSECCLFSSLMHTKYLINRRKDVK